MPTTKKTIQELNLIDDFLFNEVLNDKENGELVAKLILSVIMDREIENVSIKTQNVMTTGNPKDHAIRLDVYIEEKYGDDGKKIRVYDVEVQKESGMKSMPRRSRYYQALIDSKYLSSGTDYDKMLPLWIIIITPKDIFGKERLYYTFENRCIEEPELSLNDDARRIFLNASGTIDQKEDLSQLLKYIVDSNSNNALNETTQTLHEIVEKVRRRPDMGVKYMKALEREQFIRKESMEQGIEQGFEKATSYSIINLMNNLNWSTEQAMIALGISDDEKSKYEELIKESKAVYDAGKVE